MSGPFADDVRRLSTPTGARPEFSVAYFVIAAVRMLGEHGVEVKVRDEMVYPAELAAADFLRAIGVRPATARKV
jgi:hypothetical protein